MALCSELGIDPSSDSVLFCLASDLGSKATGEWAKEPFVQGWLEIDPSLAKMKAALPGLRKKLNSNPAYFKKLTSALDMWNLFIPPALAATPSALSKLPPGAASSTQTDEPPAFDGDDLEMWLEFQRERGKAVSKDTWSLFIDFLRTIDKQYKEYDEEAAWPSTIDDFVEYARAKKA
ncbi:hypothetical protein A1Q1_01351 [Trichosporon asahii var. asahii CBS 2479]|uniref:Defective in cullin neddylation protein n=1 Tax=Trichosporon asahii var. asahii (strain ATCC 90039 / CBS 2479 / JCM 2466 / KCTC 7840 / NBRC 103889/ NCYC 2677 / UAMH 7654) TaxID=1186058 RepID=J5T7B0_TRIAS|nr:hypothetical protein A1Q1_01351 [Trichosporon asahii var. asahii CBS 2479]EJT49546.1 hypothetical protein A1Q1_01351 [Trichosporon asahii var. asahii CBS 2479]